MRLPFRSKSAPEDRETLDALDGRAAEHPRSRRTPTRWLVAVGAVIGFGAIVVFSAFLAGGPANLLEAFSDGRSVIGSVIAEIAENESVDMFVQNVRNLAGMAHTGVDQSAAWLQSRGVAPSALPAAAQAYRTQYGHPLDEDLATNAEEVEAWLITWQAAYKAGEPWARGMVTNRREAVPTE